MGNREMYKTVRSFTHLGEKISAKSSDLLLETPLEIIINDDRNILIMFTPGMARELVIGFIFTEGLIRKLSEVEECIISSVGKEDGEQVIEARVIISSERPLPTGTQSKRVSYSSCGICGKDNYYDLKKDLGRVKSRQRFSMDVLNELPAKLETLQPLYRRTGGAHAAVLFDGEGNSLLLAEDMGRHNALDKVIGATLIKGISCQDKIVVSSGRASLEMMLKTARAGIPVFMAMSRPTSRAVEAAKFYNITLMDMAKDSNCIYSHARRIEGF
jgi:FdhD protein